MYWHNKNSPNILVYNDTGICDFVFEEMLLLAFMQTTALQTFYWPKMFRKNLLQKL